MMKQAVQTGMDGQGQATPHESTKGRTCTARLVLANIESIFSKLTFQKMGGAGGNV